MFSTNSLLDSLTSIEAPHQPAHQAAAVVGGGDSMGNSCFPSRGNKLSPGDEESEEKQAEGGAAEPTPEAQVIKHFIIEKSIPYQQVCQIHATD